VSQKPILDEHDDDKPIGRLLTRREMLGLLGGTGVALIATTGFAKYVPDVLLTTTPSATATVLPSCVVRPALTEGPYFVDGQLNRMDIRIDPSDDSVKTGLPLHIIFKVFDVSENTCNPIEGAQVDVWHCDIEGQYSGVQDQGFDTLGEMWLRGYQLTDELGVAEFLTIFPGWYSGRAVHIHFKIRTDPTNDSGYEFTSQFFFDEAMIAKIYSEVAEYDGVGTPDVPNEDDNIFQGSEGLLTLELEEVEGEEGYTATFTIGLDLSQPAPTESGSGGGPGGGGQPPRGTPPGGGGPNATATPGS
jgi:protocatechuate 3,4-dioxygenase beta subunit